jgi:YkoY family integral membrane protein
MLGQTFSFSDLPKVAVLAFLEILLSADNAVVLGLITSRLPPHLQTRALHIGFISAWIFRFIGIFFVAVLLQYHWIKFAGGLYLLYLAAHHFAKKRKRTSLLPSPAPSLWKTILMIECFDLAFAVDSIVAGIAFIGVPNSQASFHPKLWIVYVGGMIGVLAIRYAAHFFSAMIYRFPRLEMAAYVMVGWIGLKLCLHALSLTFPYFEFLFWSVLALLFLFGLTKRGKKHV